MHTKERDFFMCTTCDLIFVPQAFFLSKVEEQERYKKHQNSCIDEGYRRFLFQVIKPIKDRFPIGGLGLDFGSGPFPALAQLLQEEGYRINHYDPFFHNDPKIFDKLYDFITLTEVAEHLHHPAEEFDRIYHLLRPQAYLFVLTHRTDLVSNFKDWYYKNDSTHVCFYAQKSIEFIANKYQMKLTICNDRLVILQK